jgi:hypothetical protein
MDEERTIVHHANVLSPVKQAQKRETMVRQEYIDQLVGVQEYRVEALRVAEGKDSGEKGLVVEIARTKDRYSFRCGA